MESQEILPMPDDQLWLRYQQDGSVELRNELVEKYSYLTKFIALKITSGFQYFNYLEDLIHEGIIALVSAVEKYDPDKNVKFETYASIKIRGAVIDYIRKQDLFSRRIKKIAKSLNDANCTYVQKNGKIPSNEELARFMDVSMEELKKMQLETHALSVLSFEQIAYESGVKSLTLDPVSNHQNIEGPESELAHKELCNMLAEGVTQLKQNEQIVISLYYKDGLKIKEIAEVMEVSNSRVSQIHSGALTKLKGILADYMQS